MKKLILSLTLLGLLTTPVLAQAPPAAPAAAPAAAKASEPPKKADPSDSQRIADLEA